jgi:UDP-N-acetylmuramyl pentapeptide phosphotransferase/UDP-N-acetylglucosamine-1-phosphate transferase/HEAT repeat protein
MTAPAAPSARQSLLGNLLLSLSVCAALLGGLEGVCRLREAPRPGVADYIWDWQRKWTGDFYTMKSDANGWPPWEEFNADGLRDRTHAVEKPEGVRRIVFLGDSVTLGDQIEATQAYPRFLEADLDAGGHPAEVFSVALWGWSTRQERIAYERIARKYRPDQVVLAVCLNDIPELQNNLSRPSGWLSRLHDRSALVRRVVNAPAREIGSVEELFASPEPERVQAAFERFFAEVRALRAEVQADGAAFALVVFPFRFQVEAGAPPPRAQERIAGFCRSEGLRCVDLLPTLGPAGPAAFVDYDHLSAPGSRRVARALRQGDWLLVGSGAEERLRTACNGACPAATAWLAAQGPASPAREELARLLERDDADARVAGAWALARMGADAAPVVDRLARLLDDPRENVRRAGARALGALGETARPAADALFARLADPRQSVRWEAARSLASQSQDAATVVPRLVAALRSDDAFLRGFAAWRLGELGPAAADAVPALVEALGRDEGYGRGGASGALARMGPAAAAAVPALLDGLRADDGDRRWKAARTLGRIGPAARDAVPALLAASADPNEHVRAHSVRALSRVASRSPQVEAALARARRDRVAAVAREARVASQEMGLAAPPPEAPGRARPLVAAGAAGGIALLAALGLVPWVRDVARRCGWLDVPDGALKAHPAAVPCIGGAAVFVAFGLGLVASAHPAWGMGWQGGPLFLATGAVLLVGLADDVRGVGLSTKLGVQLAAALGLCAQTGVVHAIALPGGGSLELGVLGWPLTVAWLVTVSHAFNLIDGLDGLAASSGSISLAVLLLAALAHGEPWAPVTAALGGALLGFLRYNRAPASVFLGDGGSLSLGFALAGLALETTTSPAGEVALVVVLLALALPLTEGVLTVVRRLRARRPLVRAGRDHLHHWLLSRGLDPESAVAALVALSGGPACLAWFFTVSRPQAKLWALAGALVSLGAGLWRLRRTRAAVPSGAAAAGASRS